MEKNEAFAAKLAAIEPDIVVREYLMTYLQSPIEILMGAALSRLGRLKNPCGPYRAECIDDPAEPAMWESYFQVSIGPYHADFVLRQTLDHRHVCRVAIECDGHQFHDVSRLQAIRDRERDRYFQNHGYLIARFTGSEIWRDALACAEKAFQMADFEMNRRWEMEAANG